MTMPSAAFCLVTHHFESLFGTLNVDVTSWLQFAARCHCQRRCSCYTSFSCRQPSRNAPCMHDSRLRHDQHLTKTTSTSSWSSSVAVPTTNFPVKQQPRVRLLYTHGTVKSSNTLMPWLQLRFDYNMTMMYRMHLLPFDAIRREQKMNRQFFIVVVS